MQIVQGAQGLGQGLQTVDVGMVQTVGAVAPGGGCVDGGPGADGLQEVLAVQRRGTPVRCGGTHDVAAGHSSQLPGQDVGGPGAFGQRAQAVVPQAQIVQGQGVAGAPGQDGHQEFRNRITGALSLPPGTYASAVGVYLGVPAPLSQVAHLCGELAVGQATDLNPADKAVIGHTCTHTASPSPW